MFLILFIFLLFDQHPRSSPDKLQVLNLTVISTPECRKINGKTVHDSHLCTFNKEGEGACYVCLLTTV